MSNASQPDPLAPVTVVIQHPHTAALLAWLWPGAGHLYQRRFAKGVLFMVCILGTYFVGLSMGGGHAVYASFTRDDMRLQYICQLGVGAPAMPALVQTYVVQKLKRPPMWGGFMAPPQNVQANGKDELHDWNMRWPLLFEIGTLYTVVAGLLNIMAIYDAYAGPVYPSEEQPKKPK